VEIGQAGRKLRDVDALNAQGSGGIVTKIGLDREGNRAGIAANEFAHQICAEDMRFIDGKSLSGQVGILNAGDKGAYIEVLRGRDRSRQAALRLALRSVERILLVTVAHEEGIVRADFVIDAYVSAVITHN